MSAYFMIAVLDEDRDTALKVFADFVRVRAEGKPEKPGAARTARAVAELVLGGWAMPGPASVPLPVLSEKPDSQ